MVQMLKKNLLKPRKKPVQERSKKTVEIILDAAAQVFAEKGFSGGTTNHIAERAGVSIGSLYQYFPNKNSILLGLMERHLADGLRHMERLTGKASEGKPDPRQLLRELIEILISEQLIDPRLHKVLLEATLRSPEVLQRGREFLEDMAQMVSGLLFAIPNTRVPQKKLAARLTTITGFLLTHWFVLYGSEEIDQESFVDEMTDLLTRYLFN